MKVMLRHESYVMLPSSYEISVHKQALVLISSWFLGRSYQLSMRRLSCWMTFEEASTRISSLEQFLLTLVRLMIPSAMPYYLKNLQFAE